MWSKRSTQVARATVLLLSGMILLMACGVSAETPGRSVGRPTATATASIAGRPAHVFVVIFENQAADAAIGPEAPYLASLAARYGLATNYLATAHPSLPNYLELFSGSTQGVSDDARHDISAPTLADQLEATGLTWRVYEENYPGDCFKGASASGGADGSGDYRRKHNPAISFTSISGSAARCANITDFAHLDPDASDVAFIIPNQCHDMHDCPISAGDAWARQVLAPLISSPAMADGVLFVTFDEAHGDTASGDANRVATIVVAPGAPGPRQSDEAYSHASLLRTIEDLYHLPCLADACTAAPMNDLIAPG